jgi:hypothetical protein
MMKSFVGLMMAAVALSLAASVTAKAQNTDYCTAVCGGRAGGESANTPEVVACFRKCMGQKGSKAR